MKYACLVGYDIKIEVFVKLKFYHLFDKKYIHWIPYYPVKSHRGESLVHTLLRSVVEKIPTSADLLLLSPTKIEASASEDLAEITREYGLGAFRQTPNDRQSVRHELESWFACVAQPDIMQRTIAEVMGTNRQLLCIRSTKDCRYVPLLITAGLYTVGCLRVKEIVVTERMDRSVLGENIRDASCRYACLLYASYKVGPPPPDVTIRWDSRVYEGGRTLDAVRRFNTFLLAEQNRIELQDAKVNQDILSGGIPELPGYRSVLYERPAQQVTGDVRLIQFVRPGHVVIAVGDVSEKGTGAALRGVELMTLLKTCASQNMTPAQVCTSVDSKIRWDDGAKYATLFYAELELSTGVLTFCNAGQQSFPLLLHSRDHIEKLDCNARPIGLLTDSIYSQATVTMERGDRLLIHTDGVIELHNSEGEEFGIKRLEEIVRDSMGMAASGLKDAIMVAIDEFNQQSFEDDITLLIIDRL